MRTYKVLSALLGYPDGALLAAANDMRAVLDAENCLPSAVRAGIEALIRRLETVEPLTLQEEYVALFDRGRSTSLHLFEHVHGESRDRGQAMVNLIEAYRSHGLAISVPELPDYLPLFLEFVSLLPPAEARATLAETAHILAALASRLKRRASGYAAVFEALVRLTGDREAIASLSGVVAGPDDASDNVAALDAAWEEAPVTFGPGDAASSNCNTGCGKWANVDFIATPAKQES
ncbi:MAG TPA: nitrate reductase molybdenum cofactor assembly chaperone [Alphaproteobacteria bacterium]|nr:nitrate reductase molybdenum cofactor assembly chaperone [Alphaproteobacteria bacterium]